MTTTTHPMPPGGKGSPPWAIAKLFPNQGHWSEAEYLELSERTNRLIELIDGCVEVLDLPNLKHQDIVYFLHRSLDDFARPGQLGKAVSAAYPLRLKDGKFHEPDVLFVLAAHLSWFGEKFATGADLVIEVVSEDRRRDIETKRGEYEEAGIPEY
jgi:Uma2 family endonuclease